jgi:hypothetical protein
MTPPDPTVPGAGATTTPPAPGPGSLEPPDQLQADVADLMARVTALETAELAEPTGPLVPSTGGVLEAVWFTTTDPVLGSEIAGAAVVIEESDAGCLLAPLTPLGIRVARADLLPHAPTTRPQPTPPGPAAPPA